MPRLLIADDDPGVTRALQRGFSYEGYDVDVAASGDQALAVLRQRPPDLVVLDIMMPGVDGLEVCRRIRAADPRLPIIMLTARDATADQVAGLDLGANDYVTKPFDFEVLAARVRALLRQREVASRADELRYADLRVDLTGHQVFRDGRAVPLTATEFRLLSYLAANARQVLSKDQILEHVWGYDFGGETNVVEVYIRSLRQKLESAGESRLIQTVRGAGYVLREE